MEILQKQFTGMGEVKDFVFTQKAESEIAYIYEVCTENVIHYEVFRRKSSAVCIDFEKRIYDEALQKEVYPKSNDFGVWAWTFGKFKDAENKFNEL